jgi:hypothetical protein
MERPTNPPEREGTAALPYTEILCPSAIWKMILKMSALGPAATPARRNRFHYGQHIRRHGRAQRPSPTQRFCVRHQSGKWFRKCPRKGGTPCRSEVTGSEMWRHVRRNAPAKHVENFRVGAGCHAGPTEQIPLRSTYPAEREGTAALPYTEILCPIPIWKMVSKMSAYRRNAVPVRGNRFRNVETCPT